MPVTWAGVNLCLWGRSESSWWWNPRGQPAGPSGREVGEEVRAADPLTSAHRRPPGYVDVGLIPAGAREIRIEEVAEAANFLALRSEDPEKYFLNGGWTIQWNGEYEVAGTTFTYARTGNWENLTSPGPTHEPVWIQVAASRGLGRGAGGALCDPGPRQEKAWGGHLAPLLGLCLDSPLSKAAQGVAPGPRGGWLGLLRMVALGGWRGRLMLTGPHLPRSCCFRKATPGCAMSTPSTGSLTTTAWARRPSSPGTMGRGPSAQ